MAPLATLGVLLVVAAILSVAVAFGLRILAWIRTEADDPAETLLFATGTGIFTLELIAFTLASYARLHRAEALALLIGMALVSGNGWVKFPKHLLALWGRGAELSSWVQTAAKTVFWAAVALATLTAMAPLTGSDAMQYHFTTALAAAGSRSPLRFDILHSFLTGEGHALIALGLALGSDRIALGLLCVGGLLTAAVVFLLACRLMPSPWAWACAVAFLLTPMVLWQGSVSGAPDIWMGFFCGLAVLALVRALESGRTGWFVLAGVFAGAVGGAKYTGWLAAVGFVLICWVETRSAKRAFLFGTCALLAGSLPLLRNFATTGDPFFPFLIQIFGSHLLPSYTFKVIARDVRSPLFGLSLPHLLAFPFQVTLDGGMYGYGQLFGPLVLSFVPLLPFVPWRKTVARVSGAVWLTVFAGIAVSSQYGRFLLPVYPLALVLAVAGAFEGVRRGWRLVRVGCVATLAFFLLFSVGADLGYARDFLPVAIGRQSRKAFLERMAPDYRVVEFINRELHGRRGKVMVFFRHVYYLRVPFVYGDPADSIQTGAVVNQGPAKLLALLRGLNVRWVVKSPDFPAPLASAARKLEAENVLRPVASADVVDFTGNRVNRQTATIHVVILQVENKSEGLP
jgi:Dolichyl-phosphate-mannose-protein mannosyltransferase/Protein of unknown function (DUF1420)